MRRPPVYIIQGVTRLGQLALRQYMLVNPDTERVWTVMAMASRVSRTGAGGETRLGESAQANVRSGRTGAGAWEVQ